MPDYEGLTRLGTVYVVEWSAGQDHWHSIEHRNFGVRSDHHNEEDARAALEIARASGYYGTATRERLRVRKETQEVMDW